MRVSTRIFLMRMPLIQSKMSGLGSIYMRPAMAMFPMQMNYGLMSPSNREMPLVRSESIICKRYYGDMQKRPSQPQLPSKETVQKTAWKIVATIWDITDNTIRFSWNIFQKQVIENDNVQRYWQDFLKKLDEARRSKW